MSGTIVITMFNNGEWLKTKTLNIPNTEMVKGWSLDCIDGEIMLTINKEAAEELMGVKVYPPDHSDNPRNKK